MLGVQAHVIGCGRSGTTALGRALERHPNVRYLNEPRHIWRLDPRLDIWTDNPRARLSLGPEDLSRSTALQLRTVFAAVGRSRYAIEKLPINNFRIGYLAALHPRAKFVHLIRGGLEVARSIEKAAEHDGWFRGVKWDLLCEHATELQLSDVLPLCTDNRLRGLLEWRLSCEAAQRDLALYAVDRYVEIRYDELVGEPGRVMGEVLDFLGLPSCDEVTRELLPQSPPICRSPSGIEQRIGGPLLQSDWARGDRSSDRAGQTETEGSP